MQNEIAHEIHPSIVLPIDNPFRPPASVEKQSMSEG
jgi:hypothetical protein